MALTDFSFKFTVDKLQKCLPSNTQVENWFEAIDAKIGVLPNSINTVKRVAAFLAQTAHESGEFKFITENLNYSADALLRVFPNYFNTQQAAAYARKPEQIANHVYGNRMGNGPELSGDGWKYRGRGLLQITGKSNYSLFAVAMYGDHSAMIMANPDIITMNNSNALDTAIWFWKAHNLNILADNEDIKSMTRIINGGFNGLDDRIARYNRYKIILGI